MTPFTGDNMVIDDDWTPTAENINALPEGVKSYIHDLDSFQYSEVIIERFALGRKLETAYAVIHELKSKELT